jgi:tRNA-Thr(GGU) m(6)t(6)A37 methyltransferase TsaA
LSPRRPGGGSDRTAPISLRGIGVVHSSLTDVAAAPNQGDEGAPEAWLELDASLVPAVDGVRPGDELIVITWLDQASRDVLRVHPRGDWSRPEQGVFSTRSPHRPNPIGLHRVQVIAVEHASLHVRGLEAVDGTPILDLKPALAAEVSER